MKKPRVNKRAFRRSALASLGRVLGVGATAGAGNILHQLVGGGLNELGIDLALMSIGFALVWFLEYEREK